MSLAGLLPFFFFNDTATTEIYTLSLHDALPICRERRCETPVHPPQGRDPRLRARSPRRPGALRRGSRPRSEEHTSELQSHSDLVCRLLLEKKKPAQYVQQFDKRKRNEAVGRTRN